MSQENQKISLLVAVVIGINAMIGAGIVAIPAFLTSQAGPAGVFSFVFSTLIVLTMSYSMGRLAHLYPGEGWAYAYPANLGGHRLGMVASAFYLGGVVIAMGFVTQQAGVFAQLMIPSLSAPFLATLILLGLMLLVMAGAVISSVGQYVIAAVVLGSLALSGAVCLGHFDATLFEPFAPHGAVAILYAAPKAMFSLLGFESIASLYSIIKNPVKNVQRACILSVLIVGMVYLAFIISVVGAIPPSYFSRGAEVPLAAVLQEFFPQHKFLSFVIMVGGLFAIIGTLHSMIWSVTVLFYDVLGRAQSKVARRLHDGVFANQKVGVAFSSLTMLAVSYLLHSEVILYATVALMGFTYVTAIALLLKDFRDHRWYQNAVTIMAVLGGLTLIYCSLGKLV